ncbi:MAG TPA: hypothetical protein GXX23_02705 [Firmicutes bacterium]|nr:hypothetical protein [Candidatus Fermentithermobacillaceae bacterium]
MKILDYEKDPRPDLEADHMLWVALLTLTRKQDPTDSREGLFHVLHCLRCGGAQLVRDKDFGMLIRPGEWDKTEYEVFRSKHLASRKAEIVAVLRAAAASKLPQLEKDTLRSRIAARVKAIESKAQALGWTQQDLWAEKEWTDPRDGRRRESLCKALFSASELWGDAQIGEITSEYAEILVPGPGLDMKEPVKMRYFRVPPYLSQQPQLFANSKKEAV